MHQVLYPGSDHDGWLHDLLILWRFQMRVRCSQIGWAVPKKKAGQFQVETVYARLRFKLGRLPERKPSIAYLYYPFAQTLYPR